MTKSASKTAIERHPRDLRAANDQPRFRPVAIRAVTAACAVRGAATTRKVSLSDLPAILRDEARD